MLAVAGCVAFTSCRALDVPPPPGEGSIQGTVVFSPPGESKRPAAGATIELLGTSIHAVADAETGFFSLSPVPRTSGSMLIRFDADGDGAFDHSRSISLQSMRAGPGRVTVVGELLLSGNAGIRGSVLRADALASAAGHGGSNVFTPQGPYLAFTGDNGAFTLDSLPEGEVALAFFRDGYLSQQTQITLTAGETYSLPTVLLSRESGAGAPVRVTGSATLFGVSGAEGIDVTASNGTHATTAADGTWSMVVPSGLYRFGFEKSGYATVTLRNIAVSGIELQVPAVVLTPGTSTPPELDAGLPRFDAGVIDAGTPDAGTPDSGTPDAGLPDAGPVDAGTPDAGTPDSGTPDAGPADAGGVDAGSSDAGIPDAGAPPVAVIAPLPAFRAVNSTVMLNGSNSTGGTRPYTFHWTQTRGPAVTLSSNHAIASATPSFTTPSTPTVLGFTLSINDAFDAGSAPSAEVTLPVGSLPTAVIASGTPTTVYATQQVQFDGSGSTDSSGTGIASYLWTVSPAGVVTTGPGNTNRFLVQMPNSVSVPQAITVTLTVTNGVGISSNPVSATFTLTNAAAPTWYVDAGAGQTANAGSVVTLNGAAWSPVSGSTFTYAWTPAGEDGGTPWLLGDATSPLTTFVAPAIAGPNKQIVFTLTATSTSGLMPAQNVASTFVNVLDRTVPVVTGTSITPQGKAGTLGLWIDFSEPVDPASVTSVNVNPGSVIDRQLANGNTRLYVLTNPLIDGNSYTLQINNVRDVSPQANSVASNNINFVAQRTISPAYESTDTSPSDPRPGHVVRSLNGTSYELLLFGRRGTTPWFLDGVDPYSCSAPPCALATDTTAPQPTLTSAIQKAQRGLRFGNTAYATLQPRDYVANAPTALFVRTGSSWAVAASPPGTLTTDGVKLYSPFVESGLKFATWNANTSMWDLAGASVASSDTMLYSSDTSSAPMPQAGVPLAPASSYTYVTSKVSKSNDVRAYQLTTPPSTWTGYGPWTNVQEHRILTSGNSGVLYFLNSSGGLGATLFGWANNAWTFTSSGTTGFDAMLRSGHLWYVAANNGQIQIRMSVTGSGTYSAVLGPTGTDTFNNSASCTADSPEFSLIHDKIGLSWSEQCGAGPWKMYFRILN